jgi:tetratricopeptide (TPR) repeat protein
MNAALSATTPDMAETWHLSADLCRRFLEGRVSVPEKRAFVRHLVGQCEDCLGLLGRIVAEGGYWFGPRGAKAYAEGDYAAAFQAAFKFATRAERRIALEHLRGWGHWSALDPLLPNERFSAVIEHKDWHHWGLFRALLDAARWYRSRDPQEAADIASLALDIVEFLSPYGVGDEAAARDMRAKAYAMLADCRRIAGDLDGARQGIAKAWRWNEEGMGDPLDKAHLWRVDASYATAVGEFETAETILEKALSLYLAANERHLQGRTLIQMGETVGYANPDRGIAHIEHGLQLINAVREPRMELRAQHHLSEFLCLARRPQEALAIMDRARPLYQQFEEEAVQLRLHWLQGQIARGLGKVAEAVEILRLTREEYRARDLRREFALVSIDLAEAHVGQGETATALRLLAETTPTLASGNLHRNGLAAWLLFQKTLEEHRDQGGVALSPLFESVRLYLRRYWLVPSAEFMLG